MEDVQKDANTYLVHRCNDRCLMIIGPGDSAKDFKCQKMHSVNDSPDPTSHNLVPITYKYQQTTLDILESIGMYTPHESSDEMGTFSHYYFQPKRHMPPCNFNATCNMSPVIGDFFIALR